MATYTSTLLAQSNDAKDIQKADLDLLKKINEVNDRIDISDELQELQDIVKTLVNFNDIYPIGSTFIQFPSHNDPGTMFPGTVWENISANFAGGFFRAEGGNAAVFGSAKQTSQNLSHIHSITGGAHSHSLWSASWSSANTDGLNNSSSIAGRSLTRTGLYSGFMNSVEHSHDCGSSGGTETRPENYTIRIWERKE